VLATTAGPRVDPNKIDPAEWFGLPGSAMPELCFFFFFFHNFFKLMIF